jgi:23S rRNA (uracil1939-C5)-methyltransferase
VVSSTPVVGDRFEVEVTSVGAGGAGVARLSDGRVTFVHGTAPGDVCRVELTEVRKRWTRARLVDIVSAGPDRRTPPCPFAGECGGCTLEHLEYDAQLQVKVRLVTDALERIGGLRRFPEVEMHPSPREFRYRNRVSFTLRRSPEGRVVAGFHHLDDPNRIVDVDGRCLLPESPIGEVWDRIRAGWGPGAGRLPPGPELRLTLRALEDDQVLLLIEGGSPSRDAHESDSVGKGAFAREGTGDDGAEELLRAAEGLASIWHRAGRGDVARLLAGAADLEEEWLGSRHPVRPGVFLQVNREGARILHGLVLRELGAPARRRVVDAYCGVGVYGRRMALHGAQAVGIELDPDAARVAESFGVENFTVVQGSVEGELPRALPADLVVLNPPRAGVAEAVTEALLARPPHRLVYVSCDPATLARDVGRLGDAFRIRRIQAVDLFPQTSHVETILTMDLEER